MIASNLHARPNHAQTRYAQTQQQIHDAFDHVALSVSCTLPALLEETRARGLRDDDVRTVLAMHEAEFQEGRISDMHLLCARSNAGVLYVTRDQAAMNERASSFEGFVELWREGGGRWI